MSASELANFPAAPQDVLARLCVVTWRVPAVSARHLEAALLPTGPHGLSRAREATGARGVCYLATCQRVAWVLEGAPRDAPTRLAAFYERTNRTAVAEPEVFLGFDALRHLALVASSLDSLVPGEPQILGQFKRAVVTSAATDQASPALRHLLGLVLRTAKTIRTKTKLFEGKTSILSLAEGPLMAAMATERPTVAVCGTGEMGAKAARLVRRIAPKARLLCVGRDVSRAQSLAKTLDAEPLSLRRFMENAPPMQAMILAMAPYKPIFQPKWLHLQSQKGSLTVIDLGLPRNAIVPEPLPEGLLVHQIDELAALSGMGRRRGAAFQDALNLLEAELAKLSTELGDRQEAERLRRLAERFEEVARQRWGNMESIGVDAKARKWYDQTVRALLHEAALVVRAQGGEQPR